MTAPHVLNYDPRAHGCKCDECPLRGRTVVPPEIRSGVSLLIVGWEPGQEEERKLKPFVGPSGMELERTLALCGIDRSQVSITNARLCRKKKTEPRGIEERSLECCRPRVIREAQEHASLLLLGAQALTQLYGAEPDYADAERAADELAEATAKAFAEMGDPEDVDEKIRGEGAISKLRGFPLTILGRPALATWHPAHVLRNRRWTECFRWDVAKAFRHAAGRLEWIEPEIITNPTDAQLDYALERWSRERLIVVTDTETVGASGETDEVPDPETCRLRCVGLGSADHAIVVPFLSVLGTRMDYKQKSGRIDRVLIDQERARTKIRNFFADHGARKLLAGHNVNVYDRPVLQRHGMPLPPYEDTFDTVVADHVWDSEFPHGLDFLSSRRTDAPKHKPGHKYKWQSDFELHWYCGMDCVVDARLAPIEHRGVKDSNQIDVYRSDVEFQRACVGMHATGMYVDLGERERHRARLEVLKAEAEQRAWKFAGRRIKLGSHDQIRDFLFDPQGDCKLPYPSIETESGRASTSRDAIHEVLARPLPPHIEGFLGALLDFRRSDKSLNTFVNGANPGRDGRVHPSWSPHTVVTGRAAAAKPGVQQIPDRKNDLDSLRSMYRSGPGNILVAADMEQLELRLVAVISGDETWLDAFNRGDDVHKLNGGAYFGVDPPAITKAQRDFAKTLTYMFLYQGGAETAMRNMWKVRDPANGVRKFSRFSLTEAKLMRKRLLKAHPALPAWWDRTLKEFAARHYLETLVLGRRRYFKDLAYAGSADEAKKTEVINYRIQGTGGDLMGGSGATGRLISMLPWGLYGPGLNFHGHDSLMVEVKEEHADKAARALEEAMCTTLTVDGRTIALPAKAKRGYRWSELG